MKFVAHQVEKPWGRSEIPAAFGSAEGRRVGEVWFEAPMRSDLPLLVKYIFTSEKLSVQVHPNDDQARARGLSRGKSECWYILDAEPSATLGLGLQTPLSGHELRKSAEDGSIEQLMEWKAVAAGDFFFVPAGTIHAIGAGISLLELQQNADVTYRLYDYGRPRELHLDDAVAVSTTGPYRGPWIRGSDAPADAILLNGPQFSLVRATSEKTIPSTLASRRRWVAPLEGSASSNHEHGEAGECFLLEPDEPLTIADSSIVLVGAEGTL